MVRQVRRDQPIQRPPPRGPLDRRNRRGRERQRRLPRLWGCGSAGREPRPLADPPLQQRDVSRAQRIFLLRHPIAVSIAADAREQHAGGWVSWPDDGTILAAVEDVVVRRQRETALALVLAVALETVLLEDGLHLPVVIDSPSPL